MLSHRARASVGSNLGRSASVCALTDYIPARARCLLSVVRGTRLLALRHQISDDRDGCRIARHRITDVRSEVLYDHRSLVSYGVLYLLLAIRTVISSSYQDIRHSSASEPSVTSLAESNCMLMGPSICRRLPRHTYALIIQVVMRKRTMS